MDCTAIARGFHNFVLSEQCDRRPPPNIFIAVATFSTARRLPWIICLPKVGAPAYYTNRPGKHEPSEYWRERLGGRRAYYSLLDEKTNRR